MMFMQGMHEFDELMNKAKARVNRRFENYISQGSGWVMKSIEQITVKLTGLHRRQSYIQSLLLPPYINIL